MSLADACGSLVELLRELEGVQRVHPNPPNSINQFPAVLVYPLQGSFEAVSSGLGRAIHTIAIEIFQARQFLPETVSQVKQWPEAVYQILQENPTLSGSVQHVIWPVTYRILPLRYGPETFFGVRFEVKVKIL